MKNYIIYTFLTVIFLFVTIFSVSAATLKSGDQVVLPKDRVVSGDYFAAGETVTVSGRVMGDAYVAGGMVNVEGTIQGDLLAAGGTVNIRGTVDKDIRAAGGQLIISGTVNGNVTLAGGSITISDGAEIAGNVVTGGGTVNMNAPLPKDLVAGAGQLTIANAVAGSVNAGVGKLSLSPNAQIAGDLKYYSEETATVSEGAKIAGSVTHERLQKPDKQAQETAKYVAGSAKRGAKIINIVSAFILGFLFLRFFPHATQLIENRIQNNPWGSMGLGIVALIVAPILGIVLLVTVIGFPLAMILFFGYFFYMYIAKIFVSLVLGKVTLGYFKARYSPVVVLLVGLVIYLVITSIPVAGGLAVFVTVITGMGAILFAKKDYYQLLSSKKVL